MRGKGLAGMVTILCSSMVTTPVAFGSMIGIDWDSGGLYRVSTATASLSYIGNTGIEELGSLALAQNGLLYGATVGGDATLYKIDPSNAQVAVVGLLGLNVVFEGSLVITSDGTAYATNQGDEATAKLFEIDLSTGVASSIGTISGGPHDINGMAWRSDGMLVGLDRVTNSLLEINPATAASSVIAAVTPTIGAVGGMVNLNGTGYFATAGPGHSSYPGSNELWSCDLFTGSHSLVGSFAPTITGVGISGLALPEPGAILPLAIAGLLMIKRRR